MEMQTTRQQDNRQPGNPYGVTTNKFWNFIPAAGDKPPELLLYGAISSQQSWWEDRVLVMDERKHRISATKIKCTNLGKYQK